MTPDQIAWIKSASGFLGAIFDRLTLWIKRKPKLYVHFHPGVCVWCIARSGPQPGAAEYMQIVCPSTISNDGTHDIVVVDTYPAGTKPQVSANEEFIIPSGSTVKKQLFAIVAPVIAKKGQAWTGRIVLVDQLLRKHKSPKVTLKWVGETK